MEPSPTLALVVIARNEARCIARCLLSARNFVDHMLVLDTGSTDDTITVAASCGAEVHQAEWTADFSVARNIALTLANADWNLVLDADEWIEEGGESLLAARKVPPSIGVVLVISNDESTGQRFHSRSWIPRLLPRGVQYSGRIHEQPISGLLRVRIPLVLQHDGYNRSRLADKIGRNRALLLQDLESKPNDAYTLYQLGKDNEVYGDLPAAADYYLMALKLIRMDAMYRHDLSVRLIYCLSKTDRIDQAVLLAADQIGEWTESPDYFFALGNLFLDKAVQNPEQALEQWLPNAKDAWRRCLDIGERPELEGGIVGRGSFLAAHNLAVLHEEMGDRGKAEYFRSLSRELRSDIFNIKH